MSFFLFRAELPSSRIIRFFLALAFAFSLFSLNAWSQDNRKLIRKVEPTYPELAKKMHLSGTVKVEITIKPDGSIGEVKTLGGNPLFVSTVEDTVKQWKYAPAPTETIKLLEFKF